MTPAFLQIQHINHDETAVESSLDHVLKNRPKYQQTPSRRPVTKTFATATTSTTTEAVAMTMPDNTKATRVRVRRPGKKRTTTTTTESALDANNELPLDENYPRVTSQQLVAVTETGQQTLYEDDFDPSQYVPSRQPYEETTGENVSEEPRAWRERINLRGRKFARAEFVSREIRRRSFVRSNFLLPAHVGFDAQFAARASSLRTLS